MKPRPKCTVTHLFPVMFIFNQKQAWKCSCVEKPDEGGYFTLPPTFILILKIASKLLASLLEKYPYWEWKSGWEIILNKSS